MSYVYSKAKSLIGMPLVDDGKGNFKGECVSLVKKYANAPSTKSWIIGKTVRGRKLAEGTVIATFFGGKKYNGNNGHAAFYISQNNDGITVVDQYQGLHKVQQPTIRFKGKANEKDGVNDGDSYSVVE